MSRWGLRLRACGLGAVLCLCGAQAASAQANWSSARKLSTAELDSIRGGFLTVDGISFSFVATVQTYVNGQLALVSTMQANDPSDISRTTSQGAGFGAVTGLPGGQQLTVDGGGGTTTLLQQISNNGIRNIVATSASNQQISQTVDVTLTLAGFEKNQSAYALQNTFSNLSNQLRLGMTAGRN